MLKFLLDLCNLQTKIFLLFFQINREKKGLVEKITALALQNNWVKDKVFEKARGQVLKLTGGLYPAPLKVIFNSTFII